MTHCIVWSPALFAGDPATTFRDRIQPILKSRCAQCHGGDQPEAKIDLGAARTAEKLLAERHLWYGVLGQVEAERMPPQGETPLTAAERQEIAGWIRGELTEGYAAQQKLTGRAQFRRLSRAEYLNTFEDLFGYRPNKDLLPDDNRIEGYTKVSSALPFTSDGAYGYYQIAQELVERWVLQGLPKTEERTIRAPAVESGQSPGHSLVLDDGWIVSFNSDDTSGRLKYPGVKTPGMHKLRVHAYAYQSDKPVTFGIYKGKTHSYPQEIELAALLEAPPGKPAILETELYLDAKTGLRIIPFGLGVQVPKNTQASKCKGPGLALQWLEDEEPAGPILAERFLLADFPEDLVKALRGPRLYLREKGGYSYNKLNQEQFLSLMRTTLQRVGARVFRRDLTEQELDERLVPVAAGLKEDRNLREIVRETFVELLTSPEFFCVIESPGELSGFALASRLSYFLWNSTPDEELLQLARSGKLREPATLRQQTDRLLDDPKSARFVADFLDQWLDLNAIDDTRPDKSLYPEYDDLLKFSSLQETQAFFQRVLRENRSVSDLLAPTWAMVNARLAQHYGLPEVQGANLRVVDLPAESPFGGLWTQPVILKVTADGSSTSPVKRGVWVSKRLLGIPILPPPPNIKPINPDTRGATTLREQLALHSSDQSCAACHKNFDPYGFALESFDVMGQYRTNYRILDEKPAEGNNTAKGKSKWHDGPAVDSGGVTPSGGSFTDIVVLRKLLAAQPEKIAWGIGSHLVTFATGTPVTPLDRATLTQIVAAAGKEDYRLRSVIYGIVASPLFRYK